MPIAPEDYGLRPDGTPKGKGFFGELQRPDGDKSTELSFDFEVDGKKILAPLIVPGLSKQELQHLLDGKQPTNKHYDKAMKFALDRIKVGLSPFAGPDEIQAAPTE